MTTTRAKRTASRGSAALVLAAVVLAGCGGHSSHRTAQPKLQRALAQQLATLSERVAEKLDAGDSCSALVAANALQSQTIAAVNGHKVPDALKEPLMSAATELASRIQCAPAPPHHKGHGKGKHKGHGGEGD